MLCIKNGRIHDLVKEEPYVADILVKDGKIAAIGEHLEADGAEVMDASGRDVYPGFVDAHSHLGLDGYGIGVGTGPGSANVLGGTFFAVKTTGRCVDDMVVKDPVAMKCAFGENPKRCYKGRGNEVRMATAAHLREMLLKASDYKERKEAAGDDPSKRPAFDMKLEALIPVLNRKIPLKAHAHQANDILTAIRIAKEFHVKLTLEHTTEGNLIVDELVKAGYPCAVGPSLGHATKFELQNKTWTTPGVLAKAGCQVSIITDAPVTPQKYLSLCAAMAVRAGMEPYEALKAITINPAKHLGIEDRVGSLEVGKDADILVFSGDPLDGISLPDQVLIDGKLIENTSGQL